MVVLFLIASLLTACGNSSFSIEGNWDAVSSQGIAGTFDFKDNGTFICDLGMLSNGGDYTIEDDKLTLMYPKMDPLVYEIEINDKKSVNFYSIDSEGNRTDKENIRMTKN